MSESDSFIREVTEEVRQDRMYTLWKKWGPYILAVLVLAVGGAALWSWMEVRERDRAEQVGGILLTAAPGSIEEQRTAISVLEPPAQLVADFALAAALADAGEADEAAEAYRGIAGRADLPRPYRDLALLQALRIEAASAEPAAILAELAPLMESGAPYAPLARELAAVLHMRAGDVEAARAELATILAGTQTTQALRLRAGELMNVIGAPEADGAS